ncbi:hypothetical protein [Streptomyces sp. URMC 129]|uniref:SGM_3592 family protein n=1 Tax=Streptomyces sp. URMC 129 TaxID=3423407 RepID=UPI003F1BEEED
MGTEPTGRDDPAGDEWDDVVLDESFVRGAEVREPAARTRMLAERWKNGAPAPQPWRSDQPPAGWIYGSGRRGRSAGQRKRRWFRRKDKDGGGD